MPTLSKPCKHSNTLNMKRLLFLTVTLLWCSHIVAGVHITPADSAQAKVQIGKMGFKNNKDVKSTTTPKAKTATADNKVVTEKNNDKTDVVAIEAKAATETKAPIVTKSATEAKADTESGEKSLEQMTVKENRSSADELKEAAKRDIKNSPKKPEEPTVSFPYYPGGNIAIREFVRKNQQYPPECKRERLRGRVEVMIAIAPDGTPHSPTISKSSGNVHMDAEALRIAELMPKWNPAPESDDPQGIDYVIFVNFRPGR